MDSYENITKQKSHHLLQKFITEVSAI